MVSYSSSAKLIASTSGVLTLRESEKSGKKLVMGRVGMGFPGTWELPGIPRETLLGIPEVDIPSAPTKAGTGVP